MKIIQINTTSGAGSTGKICEGISKQLNNEGIENYIFYDSGLSTHKNSIKFSSWIYNKIQVVKSRIFGNYGFEPKLITKQMIKLIDSIGPDIIHLHNIHAHNCNYEMLFKYAKRKQIKIIWTFHDCWAFTGYCTHFTLCNCEKWMVECNKCPQWKRFSWLVDKSKKNYIRKKESIEGLDLLVVTPSLWMKHLVEKSFFKLYQCRVINNGIDLSIFKPTPSTLREKLNLQHVIILLFVAYKWDFSKGLDVVFELSAMLNETYQIIIIGKIDDKTNVPTNVIHIDRTNDVFELAEYYSMADLFINPTREDTYPTVNIEAMSCGTPVITFKTGGSPEIIGDYGFVTKENTVQAIYDAIKENMFLKLKVASGLAIKAKDFDMNNCFSNYINLYKEIVNK